MDRRSTVARVHFEASRRQHLIARGGYCRAFPELTANWRHDMSDSCDLQLWRPHAAIAAITLETLVNKNANVSKPLKSHRRIADIVRV